MQSCSSHVPKISGRPRLGGPRTLHKKPGLQASKVYFKDLDTLAFTIVESRGAPGADRYLSHRSPKVRLPYQQTSVPLVARMVEVRTAKPATSGDPEDATSLQSHPHEASPSDPPKPPSSGPPIQYTTFTRRQKRLLTCILILTMLASPLTATIYLPLLPLLASQFHVSHQAINLTITVYIVFQAVSPLCSLPLRHNWPPPNPPRHLRSLHRRQPWFGI